MSRRVKVQRKSHRYAGAGLDNIMYEPQQGGHYGYGYGPNEGGLSVVGWCPLKSRQRNSMAEKGRQIGYKAAADIEKLSNDACIDHDSVLHGQMIELANAVRNATRTAALNGENVQAVQVQAPVAQGGWNWRQGGYYDDASDTSSSSSEYIGGKSARARRAGLYGVSLSDVKEGLKSLTGQATASGPTCHLSVQCDKGFTCENGHCKERETCAHFWQRCSAGKQCVNERCVLPGASTGGSAYRPRLSTQVKPRKAKATGGRGTAVTTTQRKAKAKPNRVK